MEDIDEEKYPDEFNELRKKVLHALSEIDPLENLVQIMSQKC